MQWLGAKPDAVAGQFRDTAICADDVFPAGPLFRFLRYDVRLEADWLEEHLDIKLSAKDLARVREMDNPDSIPLAYDIGQRAAERQVKAEHWIVPHDDAPSRAALNLRPADISP